MSNFPTFLCRESKRNFYIAAILNKLICFGLGTMLDLNGTITGDIRATGGSVNVTCGCVNCAINYNLSIYNVCIGPSVFSTRSITYRDKSLISRTTISTPIISIVDVNVISTSKGTLSTLANDNLGTGEECDILVDCDITGHCLHGHVVLNTKLVVLRVNARCTDRHIDRRYGYITICLNNESVGILIIILNNIPTSKVKHSVLVGNKCYCRTKISARHIHSSVRILRCAGIESKRNLNILEIVLRKREYAIIHIGGLCTATEVHDLEVLINSCTTLSNNGTRANNKAVCKKLTSIIDCNLAIVIHSNERSVTCGRTSIQPTTLCIIMLCRKIKFTIYNESCTRLHCKSTIFNGLHIRCRS